MEVLEALEKALEAAKGGVILAVNLVPIFLWSERGSLHWLFPGSLGPPL